MRGITPLFLLLASCAIEPAPTDYRLNRIRPGDELYLQVNGRRICLLDKGKGPALLLLHGVGGSGYDWRHQIDKLADSGFRVIVPDLLGSGYTDHPGDGDYSPHGQAILLLGLMNQLGVDKVSIIGNSYGAGIGLVMAFHHPDRVERLALLDPAIIPQALPLAVMMVGFPPFGEIILDVMPLKWLVGNVLRRAYFNDDLIRKEDVNEYYHENRFRGNIHSKLAIMSSIGRSGGYEFHERLPEIEHRTLVLWGEEDTVTFYENAETVVKLMPNSKLVTIPQCGHLPHMECPETVFRLLLDFLGDLRTRELH